MPTNASSVFLLPAKVEKLARGSGRVSVYRVYIVGQSGHVDSIPQYIECRDDAEAVQQARQIMDGHSIEIWEGTRIVKKLAPKK